MTTSANTLPPVTSMSPKEQLRYEGYQERLQLSVDDLVTHTAARDLNQLVAPQLTQPRSLPLAANLNNLDLYNDLVAATRHMARRTKHSRDALDGAIDDELRTNADHYASLAPSQLEAARNMVRRSVFGHETANTSDGAKIVVRPQHYRRTLRQNAAVLREAQQSHTYGEKERFWTKIKHPGAYVAALVTSNGFYARQKFRERMAVHRQGATDPEIKAGTAGVVIAGIVVLYGLTRSIIALKHGFDTPHIGTPDIHAPKVDIPTPRATLPDLDPPKVTTPRIDLDPDTPQTYHVVKGDTLREIARDTLQDVKRETGSTKRITDDIVQDTYRRIARDNHISNADRIYPGQHLRLSPAVQAAERWFGADPTNTPVTHAPTTHTQVKNLLDALPSQRAIADRIDEYQITPGEGLYRMLDDLGIEDRRVQSAIMHELQDHPSARDTLTRGPRPFMYEYGNELRLSRPGIITEVQERRFTDVYQRLMADRVFHENVMRRLLDEATPAQ